MADSSADTTTLVVVAALVVVAVMWSRRGTMGYGGGAYAPPMPAGSTGPSATDVISAARDLFSGFYDAYKATHSSDDSSGYMIPSSSSSSDQSSNVDFVDYGGTISEDARRWCVGAGYVDNVGNPTTECLATYG